VSSDEKQRLLHEPETMVFPKGFEKNDTMNSNPSAAANTSEFELRARQAILSAKHNIPQVAILLFAFDTAKHGLYPGDNNFTAFYNSISMRLRGGLRDSDTVSLLSSGHIGVLLQSVQGPQDLELVTNRLLTRLEEPVQLNNLTFTIEPRVGASLFPEHGDSVRSLIEHAENDLVLFTTTRKPFTIYASHSGALISARQWMSELRQAIVSDQLFLTFQPKVSLLQERVTGVEVLLRWQHPQHGIIVPDQFIPLAERTGLIIPLTLWVLQQSLMQCRQWKEIGLDIGIAVNLTMWNLEAQELPEQIEALLRDTGVSPENLELEITETSIMSDPQRVIRTLEQIRHLGVRFAIDDFGTGYSSFAYLTKLPVSCIKIDKSFIQNIETDRDSSVIVKAIIDLGHNLGLKIVAEGVETIQSKRMLRVFQCDEGQGYYFCRPVPADAMTQFLLESSSAPIEQPLITKGTEKDRLPFAHSYNPNP
jgi:EAL domain-containing protein (putative c-di-GMP-specific phosphodiesterase class I)/GGDEF domain-containing protein